MGLILDSSVIVAFERGRFDLERLLQDYSPHAIAAITAGELLIGVERADTPERRVRRETFVLNIISRLSIIPFDLPQARIYAEEFATLASSGRIIGDRDLQIASTALSIDCSLATLNVGEFQRLPRLRLVPTSPYALA